MRALILVQSLLCGMLLCYAPSWIGQRTLVLYRSPSSKSRARAQRTSRRRASRSGGSSSRRMSAPTTMYSRSCRCGRSGALAMHLAVSTLDPCSSSAAVPTLAPAPSYPVWSLVLRRRFACGLESHAARALVYVAWCTLYVAASQARCSCAQEACSICHERAVIVRGNRCVQAPDTVPSLGPIMLAFRRNSRIPAAPSLARSTPPIPYNAIVCCDRS